LVIKQLLKYSIFVRNPSWWKKGRKGEKWWCEKKNRAERGENRKG